jgi:Dirigent-like protein
MSAILGILLAIILAVLSFGIVSEGSFEAYPGATTVEVAPAADGEATSFVLVERAASITNLDLGDPGPSAGDMIVWGPNALYDESNTTNSGATTQGFCVSLDSTSQCLLTESIFFEDGSMLQLQGIQAAGSGASTRFIVGGSGLYLGATGIVHIEPSDDLTTWIKTFEVKLRAGGGNGSDPAAESSPAAAANQREFTLVERAGTVTFLDLGEPGASPGDTTVWGPNPLYDESNTSDFGATTQGYCLYLDNLNHCVRNETVMFENGDMLQIHGTWDADSNESGGIIVGGSGQYQGATGTMSAHASENFSTWAKTFTISL